MRWIDSLVYHAQGSHDSENHVYTLRSLLQLGSSEVMIQGKRGIYEAALCALLAITLYETNAGGIFTCEICKECHSWSSLFHIYIIYIEQLC